MRCKIILILAIMSLLIIGNFSTTGLDIKEKDNLTINKNLQNIQKNKLNFVPGKVLVGIKEKDLTQKSASFLKTEYSGEETEIYKTSNLAIVDVEPGKELDYIEYIKDDERIEYASLNYINFIFRTPNDPMFSQQWGLDQSNDYDINAPEGWDDTTGDPDVKIAIIDTGVDYHHEDLADNCVSGYDFVDDIDLNYYKDRYGLEKDRDEDYRVEDDDPMDVNGHGTHCSGIASAVTGNGVGIAGVGWSCKIMPIRAGFNLLYEYDGEMIDVGCLEDKDIIQAIDCAYLGLDGVLNTGDEANVISMSFGKEMHNPAIEYAINRAWNNGVVLVASTGNSYKRVAGYPALYQNVIGVGAINSQGRRCDFSNYGQGLSLMAPGEDILSTVPGDSYESYSGTSMACPHVAGVAALGFTREDINDDNGNGYINDEIRARLESSADHIGPVMEYGNGLVDATFEEDAPPDEPEIFINITVDYIKILDYVDGIISVSETKEGELFYNITVADTDDYYEEKKMQTQFRYNKEGLPDDPFGWNKTDEWDEDGFHQFKPFEGQSWIYVTIRVSEWDGIGASDKLDTSEWMGNDDCTTCTQKWDSREFTVEYYLDRTNREEYTGNGEEDGSAGDEPIGEKKQDDAEIRIIIEDNYNPPDEDSEGLTAEGFKDGYQNEVNSNNPGWVDPDDTVTFTASIEGGATPYTWDFYFGDGNNDTVETEVGERICTKNYQYSLNSNGASRILSSTPSVYITDYLGKTKHTYFPAPRPGIVVTNPPTKPSGRYELPNYYVSSTDPDGDGLCFYFNWDDTNEDPTRNPTNYFVDSGEEVTQQRKSDVTVVAVDEYGAYSEEYTLDTSNFKPRMFNYRFNLQDIIGNYPIFKQIFLFLFNR